MNEPRPEVREWIQSMSGEQKKLLVMGFVKENQARYNEYVEREYKARSYTPSNS